MKIVLLYITFVGLLFIGLLGILRVGEKLKAPIDVSGDWVLSEDFTNNTINSCTPLIFRKKNHLLSIEQSGIYLKAAFNDDSKLEFTGKLDNNKITLTQTNHSKTDSAAECGKYIPAEISAEVALQNGEKDELSGNWSIPNCNACKSIAFNAVKMKPE